MLVVGPQAAAAGRLIAAQTPCAVATATSTREAALIPGRAGVILLDAGPEAEHLEAAIRNLRHTNPEARLVLLCGPVHEALCRHALQWGADDYEIVPLDHGCLRRLARQLAGADPAPENRAETATRAYTQLAPAPPQAPTADDAVTRTQIAALPLDDQAELLEEILAGTVGGGEDAGNRTAFARRATALLAQRLGLSGELLFIPPGDNPEAPPPKTRAYHRPVEFAGQPPLGTLVWTPPIAPSPVRFSAATASTTGEEGALAQAARWLGALLALAQRHEQLRGLAITDELSGAYNRRYFMTYMNALLDRSREKRSRVTLLLFDIDDFKRYNDTFGHASGDAIIRELIKLLRACTRPKDLVARIGGDEFAVVYWDNEPPRQPNSNHPKEILAATERFREAIKNHQWPETCKIKGTISISGGLASFPWDSDTLEGLMGKADEALLRAKAAGKNAIVLHGVMSAAPDEARALQF